MYQISNISADPQIAEMTAGARSLISNLTTTSSLLNQNVHIDANFPNVKSYTEIEQALSNVVNVAAMNVSGYRN